MTSTIKPITMSSLPAKWAPKAEVSAAHKAIAAKATPKGGFARKAYAEAKDWQPGMVFAAGEATDHTLDAVADAALALYLARATAVQIAAALGLHRPVLARHALARGHKRAAAAAEAKATKAA